MAENIGGAAASGKEIALGGGDELTEDEVIIVPPLAPTPPRAQKAAAVAQRLARDQVVSPALLAALQGSLGEVVAMAAAYAADALSEATSAPMRGIGHSAPRGAGCSRST